MDLLSQRIPPEGAVFCGKDGVSRKFIVFYRNDTDLVPLLVRTVEFREPSDKQNQETNGIKAFLVPKKNQIESLVVQIPGNRSDSGRLNWDVDSGRLIEIKNGVGHNWKFLPERYQSLFDSTKKVPEEIRVTATVSRRLAEFPIPGDAFTLKIFKDCQEYNPAIYYCMKREQELLNIAQDISGIDFRSFLKIPTGTSWLSFVSD